MRAQAEPQLSAELDQVLERESLQALFQPIVDGMTRTAVGHEALIRGPAHSSLHLPTALFAAAHTLGRGPDLERACLAASLRDFARLGIDGRLFVNVLPGTLLGWAGFAQWLERRLVLHDLDAHDIVVELTEHGVGEDESLLARAVAPLRALGCDIALDDLGAGVSGLKTWSAVRPDYVKVDRYFVSGIEQDPVRAEILRSVVDMGRAMGCRVIAEGVENAEQCGLVLELGVDHVQGFLLGRPAAVPQLEAGALAAFGRAAAAGADCAEHLALPVSAISAAASVAEVVERFRREPSWAALPVVEGRTPVGIVRRDELLIMLSKPLHPEIYNRKPVASVMDRNPVQIDARARLEQVSRLVTGQSDAGKREDFIITRHGAYLGMGRMIDLLRQITAQQLQAARHSNPLTGLPGNLEIQSHLSQWLTRRRPFVACHLDLDHFKAFNDAYGYARGDQVLMHVAAAIVRAVRPRVDFVGHVGGDDFVFLLRSQDWSQRVLALMEELAASLVNFHSGDHREAGHLAGYDRDGAHSRFPLLSASIAVVEAGVHSTAESVGDQLRRAKTAAKAEAGNCCMVMTAEGRLVDLRALHPAAQRVPFGIAAVNQA